MTITIIVGTHGAISSSPAIPGGAGGPGVAYSNTTVPGDLVNEAIAYGGNGGSSPGAAGGAGGYGSAVAVWVGSSTSAVTARARGVGGGGGGTGLGAVAGAGGDGLAAAAAQNVAGDAIALAYGIGGAGASSDNGVGANGGRAEAYAKAEGFHYARAAAYATGGAGGYGRYGGAGNGVSAKLVNRVRGSTNNGDLVLRQIATGGNANPISAGTGAAGNPGGATSVLTFNDAALNTTTSHTITARVAAYAGASNTGLFQSRAASAAAELNLTGAGGISAVVVAKGGSGASAPGVTTTALGKAVSTSATETVTLTVSAFGSDGAVDANDEQGAAGGTAQVLGAAASGATSTCLPSRLVAQAALSVAGSSLRAPVPGHGWSTSSLAATPEGT